MNIERIKYNKSFKYLAWALVQRGIDFHYKEYLDGYMLLARFNGRILFSVVCCSCTKGCEDSYLSLEWLDAPQEDYITVNELIDRIDVFLENTFGDMVFDISDTYNREVIQ